MTCTGCPPGWTTASQGGVSLADCSVFVSPAPPIVSGLVAYYTADSWNSSSNRWIDLSGAGNHVTEVGGATAISVLKGQGGAPSYVYGASTAWMKFPVGILPSAAYTLLHVARYNGNTKRRIFQGVDGDFSSGFYDQKAGVSWHSSCNFITQSTNDVHGDSWVVSADRSDSYRSNGVDRTTNKNNNCAAYDRLAINAGYAAYDSSDFAVQTVLVYNRKLVDADIILLENWLFGNTSCGAGQVFVIGTFSCAPCPVGMYKPIEQVQVCTGINFGGTCKSIGYGRFFLYFRALISLFQLIHLQVSRNDIRGHS
jgi:hypothetical protein